MLTLDLALQIRASGVDWSPAPGDRFVVPGRDMDDEIFVVSEMTIEVHEFPTGSVIGFNGTTEWALDSLDQGEVVWLPREDQLREMVGNRFRRLDALPGGFAVVTVDDDGEHRHIDIDAERAYARAVLSIGPGA
jgi:hypothetical protein